MSTSWEIVCPDGHVRHLPYMERKEAEFEADLCDDRGCEWLAPFAAEAQCPGVPHRIRPASLPESL
jgi:hypothetical protein